MSHKHTSECKNHTCNTCVNKKVEGNEEPCNTCLERINGECYYEKQSDN